MVKVVYIYNLKEGVSAAEFQEYYFTERIAQVMKIPNLIRFAFNIAVPGKDSAFRYMAECTFEDLRTAEDTLASDYFKDVHGYIASRLKDMQVMFFETHEYRPAEAPLRVERADAP